MKKNGLRLAAGSIWDVPCCHWLHSLALRGTLLGSWSQISDLPRGWAQKIILTVIAVPQYAAKFFIPLGLRASYDLPAMDADAAIDSRGRHASFRVLFIRTFSSTRGWPLDVRPLGTCSRLVPMLPVVPIRAFFAERFFYFSSMGAAALDGVLDRCVSLVCVGSAVLWLAILLNRHVSLCRGLGFRCHALALDRSARAFERVRAHVHGGNTLRSARRASAIFSGAGPSAFRDDMALAAWNNLAVLALAQQQPKKALYWTAQVLKHRPDSAQALYNRWRALKAAGATREAETLRRRFNEGSAHSAAAFALVRKTCRRRRRRRGLDAGPHPRQAGIPLTFAARHLGRASPSSSA